MLEKLQIEGSNKRRSRGGCLTCKHSHKRCCETKPVCSRCQRLGHGCSWPDPNAPRAKRRRKAASPDRNVPEVNTPPVLPNPSFLDGFHAFENHMQEPSPSPDIASIMMAAAPLSWQPPRLSPPAEHGQHKVRRASASETNSSNSNSPTSIHLPDLTWNVAASTSTQPDIIAVPPLTPNAAGATLPAIYDCRAAKSLVELLPAAFIWLNTYWVGDQFKHIAAYASYIDELFSTNPGAVSAAAFCSAAAFFASQRFDLDRNISLEKTTGQAWARLTGLSDLQSSLAEVGTAAKEQFPSIRASARRLVEEYLQSLTAPVFLQINCMYDMALTDFIMDGATKANVWLDRIGTLLQQVFPTASPLALSMLVGYNQHALVKFIATDVFRSILHSRRTAFGYTCDSCLGVSRESKPPSTEVFGLQWLLGCPDEIFCGMAAVSNLAADIRSDPFARTETGLSSQYAIRACLILEHINSFNPSLCSLLRGTGLHNAARTAVQELWRQTALIHYYQAVEGLSAEDERVQNCLLEFCDICQVIELGLPALFYAPLTLPLFLAGTIAIDPHRRNELRNKHAALFEVAGYRDGHRFLEKVWSDSFAKGKQVDWRTLPGRSGLSYI